MNKRIKFKKGILQKKCGENCELYKAAIKYRFVTACGCGHCKHYGNEKLESLLEKNMQIRQ